MNSKKNSRAAFVLLILTALVLVCSAASMIINLFFQETEWRAFSVIATAIGALIILTALTVSLFLLWSVRAQESPFNHKSILYLKIIALSLIVYEPYMYILQRIQAYLYPLVLEGGIKIVVHSPPAASCLSRGSLRIASRLSFSTARSCNSRRTKRFRRL